MCWMLRYQSTVIGWTGTSRIWAERLRVLDREKTEVLATYGVSNGWLDGQPAITRHPYGKGMVTYIGAYLDEVSQKHLLQQDHSNGIRQAGDADA